LNACLGADENEAYIIGIIIGGFIGLMIFVIVLYSLVRWMKRKTNEYNNLAIKLPDELDVPQIMTDTQFDDNTPLSIVDELSSLNSDSSGSKDSRLDINSGETRAKNNKISSIPTINEVVNPLYDHPFNHTVCIFSLSANSEPSLYDLPIREKPEMAKSLSNIIQYSSTFSDQKMNCIICDTNNSRSKSSTRTSSPNYYKFGVKRQIHFPNLYMNSDVTNILSLKTNQTKATNGYVPIDRILNNNVESISRKPVKNRLEHDWSQNSYDAEVSSTSSNGNNEQTVLITQPISLCRNGSANINESENIQNNSLIDIKANGHQFPIESPVHSLITSSKDKSSNLNAIEPELSLNEILSSNSPSHESTKSKTSPNHLPKNSNGYVSHNALTHLNANKAKPKSNLIKKANGYVVIDANDGFEMRNGFVPNNNIVNHITQV
jgi:hypothetical protein